MKNMTQLATAVVLALCLPVDTRAQPCGSRVVVGAAAGWLKAIPVDSDLAGGGRQGRARAGTGLEGSLHASFPITSTWSLLTEFGATSPDVLLERDAFGAEVQHKTGDPLTVRRLHIGLVRYDVKPHACVYWSVRAGVYRFAYRGVTLNAPGGAAAVGVEVPIAESGSLFFETDLYLALTRGRPPVSPELALANLRPAFGFRYRF